MISSSLSRLCPVAALTLLVTLAPASAQPNHAGKRYAVLVGVKSYDHSALADLRFTENDVTELGKVLHGAGYEVTLLSDSAGKKDPSRTPTGQNIRSALKRVLGQCTKRDTVVVAFSGHGLQFGKKEGAYFCPSDTRPSDPKTMVSLKEVYEELDDSGAGVKLMLIDACRNDPRKGSRSRNAGVNADDAPRPPRGVAALFSCSRGQVSWEADALQHGVFFYHVLEGLKGKARDADGEVTWDGLSQYVRRQVTRAVPKLVGSDTYQEPNELKDTSGLPPVLLKVQAATAAKPVLHGLLVGIDDYGLTHAGDSKPFPSLTGCDRDVSNLRAAFLRQKGFYQDVKLRLLTDRKAKRSAILDELNEAARAVGPDDLFVLYLAGRCQGDTFASCSFHAADHDVDRPGSQLKAKDLQAALARVECRKLVVVDACHSGALVPERTPSDTVYLCACQASQEAHEAKDPPGGLFTRAFVEALSTQSARADTDGDGKIDVDEALAYARGRVRRLLEEQKLKPTAQVPVLSGGGKMILGAAGRE